MYDRLSQAVLIAVALFLAAVVLTMSTSGTLSDVGFFAYAAALVVLVGLAPAWLVARRRLRTAAR